MRTLKISFIIFCFLGSVLAASGEAHPDRLRMGLPLEALESSFERRFMTNASSPTTYILDFEEESWPIARLICKVHPVHGLYAYSLIGKPLMASADGTQLIQDFKKYMANLETRFGKARLEDYLKSGSQLRAANQWLTAVRRGERILRATWFPVTNDLASVVLSVQVMQGSDSGYTITVYTFENAVEAERKAQ